jgi:hypothetical protein
MILLINISEHSIGILIFTVQNLGTEKRDWLKKYPIVTTHDLDCANFIGIPFLAMHREAAKAGQSG